MTPALLPALFAASSPAADSAQSLVLYVAHEPALAARALRLAMLHGEPADTVSRALSRFDGQRLRRLVLEALQRASGADPVSANMDMTGLWRFTVATALAARRLAQTLLPEHAETAFTAGLLRNVGLLALVRLYPLVVRSALDDAADRGSPLNRALVARTGLDQCALSRIVVQDLQLPTVTAEAVGAQPDDFLAPPLARLILAAEAVSLATGFPGWAPGVEAEEVEARIAGLGGDAALAASLIAFAQASVFRVGATLGVE